ncbi:alpha/beta fold hydrolase [Actinokineospora sp.]|uniref:alpha/beta fold hydrolase n=1 Tax=Actinokineospora sp. TaxID=1872133 RepID=UPI004037FC96
MSAVPASSQLGPHRAVRADLPGRFGPIGALHVQAPGPIVLLVPGYTGSKEDFVPVLDPIADAGFEVVAIDLPGQQDSPGPADENAFRPATLGLVLADLIGKLAAEGRPVVLVGHSYGGLVSRRAVLAGAPVVGLTLLSTGPSELPAGPRRQILDLGDPMIRHGGVAAAHQALELVNAGNPRWLAMPETLREFFRARFLRNTAPALLGMGHGLREEPDLVADLHRTLRSSGIGCLVACGANDDAWPPSVQRDMADRLDADFSMIEAAAHSPAVENPDGLLSVLLPTWQTWLNR